MAGGLSVNELESDPISPNANFHMMHVSKELSPVQGGEESSTGLLWVGLQVVQLSNNVFGSLLSNSFPMLIRGSTWYPSFS